MGFSRQEYWRGLPFPSPGVFLTQGSNPGLPHCRQTLYHVSQDGSPERIKTRVKEQRAHQSLWLWTHRERNSPRAEVRELLMQRVWTEVCGCRLLFFFFWPYCVVCEILVPQAGIEPRPRQWKHGVLTTGPPGIPVYFKASLEYIQ